MGLCKMPLLHAKFAGRIHCGDVQPGALRDLFPIDLCRFAESREGDRFQDFVRLFIELLVTQVKLAQRNGPQPSVAATEG